MKIESIIFEMKRNRIENRGEQSRVKSFLIIYRQNAVE